MARFEVERLYSCYVFGSLVVRFSSRKPALVTELFVIFVAASSKS